MTAVPPLPECAVVDDMRRQPAVLRGVLARNAAALSHAAALLRSTAAARLVGLGSSRHAAGYGALALDVFAHRAATVLPAPGAAVPMPTSRPDDVLVAVSQSGSTPALVEFAAAARTRGTSVIAVVNDPASPLAQLADVTLDCAAGHERAVAATASVTAQMLLLRALAGGVSERDVADLADAVARLLEQPPLPAGPPPAHIVAGGFAAEWVAEEVALKFAEIAGVLPSSDSLVDNLHGPAAVAASTLALLDDSDGNAAALLGRPGVTTVGPSARYDCVVPALAEPALDAIQRIVVGQVLAVRTAVGLGADPDDAYGLQKVTATT